MTVSYSRYNESKKGEGSRCNRLCRNTLFLDTILHHNFNGTVTDNITFLVQQGGNLKNRPDKSIYTNTILSPISTKNEPASKKQGLGYLESPVRGTMC